MAGKNNNDGRSGGPSRFRNELKQTFRSLKDPSYRLYAAGQLISQSGSWMQGIALSWLVYSLTDSATLLGLVSFSSLLPVFLLSYFAGGVADRFNRQTILKITQSIALLHAAALAYLTITGMITVPIIIGMAVFMGIVIAFDIPARQAFVHDLVKGELVSNAVSLNSAIFNGTRLIGPTLAGVLIAGFGEGVCFAVNAVSYLASVAALFMIRCHREEEKEKAAKTAPGARGLWVILKETGIARVLGLSVVVSLFGYQYTVLLTVIVRDILNGEAFHLGMMSACMGVGAVTGALILARAGNNAGIRVWLGYFMIGLAAGLGLLAYSTTMTLSMVAVGIAGLATTMIFTGGNSFVQLAVPGQVRGRVMAIWSMCMIGLFPFGSLMGGWAADLLGVPIVLGINAFVVFIAGLVYLWRVRSDKNRTRADE